MADKKRILVAGDIMLDSYHFGKVNRISPEAPVPVFLETGIIKYVPGGAANVAVNLVAIGIQTDIFSVVGDDANGRLLINLIEDKGIDTRYICRSEKRATTDKLRYIGQNNQQILRVDIEMTLDNSLDVPKELFAKIEKNIEGYGLILISDYMKGFLNEEVTQWLIGLGKSHDIPVLVDVKDKNWKKYRNATLLKPNRKELHDITGMDVEDIEDVTKAAKFLCKKASCSYVLTTLGADGMLLVDAEREILRAESVAKEVYDVTGAGDTSIAYLAAAFMEGKALPESVKIANFAAGIQVSKLGTSIVYPEEVERAMQENNNSLSKKQLNYYVPRGLAKLEHEKEKGRKIVFTNGCFDILHAGHVTYLKEAKKLGDILVVGINSDASVKRLKGELRPVNNLSDRLLLLSALETVDYVVAFEEDTPMELIRAVSPDVLVKGGDYKAEDIVGAYFVKSHGGMVATIPLVSGKSTTTIISKIQEK